MVGTCTLTSRALYTEKETGNHDPQISFGQVWWLRGRQRIAFSITLTRFNGNCPIAFQEPPILICRFGCSFSCLILWITQMLIGGLKCSSARSCPRCFCQSLDLDSGHGGFRSLADIVWSLVILLYWFGKLDPKERVRNFPDRQTTEGTKRHTWTLQGCW